MSWTDRCSQPLKCPWPKKMGGFRDRKEWSRKYGRDESGQCVAFIRDSALEVKHCRKLWVGSEVRVFGGLEITSF